MINYTVANHIMIEWLAPHTAINTVNIPLSVVYILTTLFTVWSFTQIFFCHQVAMHMIAMVEHITNKMVYLMILGSYIVFQVTSLSKMQCNNNYLTLWSIRSVVKILWSDSHSFWHSTRIQALSYIHTWLQQNTVGI